MLEGKAQQVMSYSHSESHSGSQIHSQLPQRWLVSSWAAFSRLESSLGVSGGLRALWPNQPTAQELSGRCTGSRRALRISAQVEELLGRSTSRTKSSSARELSGRNTCMNLTGLSRVHFDCELSTIAAPGRARPRAA